MTRPTLARLLALLATILLAHTPTLADPPREDADHISGDAGERLARAVALAASERGFSGAVLAAIDGKVVAAVGAGHADLAGEQPNTPATLFEIASLSKQFTAAAALALADRERLKLDDPISRHLPAVPENCAQITLEHLLRHTSGIPGSNAEGGGDDIDAVLPSFLRGGPRHAPGTRWEYWNQGYAIATEIIARAAGVAFTDFCKQNIFAPAGMTVTCFTGDEPPAGALVAVGRSSRGQPRSALEHPYGGFGFQYRGMGGVVTNVWDLWRWDRVLHAAARPRGEDGNRGGDVAPVLSPGAIASFFQPGPGGYALGWFVRRDAHGRLVHSHGGGVRGFTCELRRYPEHNGLLIVLCNRDDVPIRQVADSLESVLFGGEPGAEAPGAAGALDPAEAELRDALIGRYTDAMERVLIIEPDGAITRAAIHWSPTGPVTRATLKLGRGRVSLDDGSDIHQVGVQRKNGEPAHTLTILNMKFRRTLDDKPPPR